MDLEELESPLLLPPKKPLENLGSPWLHLGYPWISRHLVDEADGGSLAAIKEFHIDDLELFQADVEGL